MASGNAVGRPSVRLAFNAPLGAGPAARVPGASSRARPRGGARRGRPPFGAHRRRAAVGARARAGSRIVVRAGTGRRDATVTRRRPRRWAPRRRACSISTPTPPRSTGCSPSDPVLEPLVDAAAGTRVPGRRPMRSSRSCARSWGSRCRSPARGRRSAASPRGSASRSIARSARSIELFPTPARLAAAADDGLGMPAIARRRDPGVAPRSWPVGVWICPARPRPGRRSPPSGRSAGSVRGRSRYVAMRALRDPDAFPCYRPRGAPGVRRRSAWPRSGAIVRPRRAVATLARLRRPCISGTPRDPVVPGPKSRPERPTSRRSIAGVSDAPIPWSDPCAMFALLALLALALVTGPPAWS